MNWIGAGKREVAGKHIKLASLTPKFDEGSHRVYYDLLSRAIDAEGVRNVALTGAYGTGKSSVLEQLRKQRERDVIEISLSTIVPPQRQAVDDGEAEHEKAKTNLIQKEIVKQLLYRLPAHKTPRSRFRRTSAPQTRRDWIVSFAAGALAVAVALVLGLLQPLVESVVPEPWGRRLVAYGVVLGSAICAVWLIRRLISGNPVMSASVGAGITSVTLSSTASTYFDEYLDEIVYFFQASKTKVVVIEDIDRFEDIQVFDTLRALNVLLNSSSALGRIVFVYAIRDSIFEQIEKAATQSDDLTRTAVKVADRAKFFDVIVPVVPFVSADNARDLMSRAMRSADFSIDQSLIRIAARHTADMRLIHNIRNEFEVYRNRLILPEEHVYGIDEDLVFAMIVFKNAHLADFEKIRHKDSTLDHLYTSWRDLVRSNLKTETARLAMLRAASENDDAANERARDWSKRFLDHVQTLHASLQRGNRGQTTLSFVGDIDESMLTQRTTWHSIASGTPVTLRAYAPSGANLYFTFSADQIGALLGVTIDQTEWGEGVLSELEQQMDECEANIQFLRHHTWEQLILRPEFKLEGPHGVMTFEQLLYAKAASPLVIELIRQGFITSHFALYTSTYYGTHLGPEALEYVRRCIEPGEPDILFPLDAGSVQQLLIEQGADKDDTAEIFSDASMLNVSIVDYLIKNRPAAADRISKRLSAWKEREAEFVSTYCARGEQPEWLLRSMAAWWPEALKYTAIDAPLPPEKRVLAVDAVIGNLLGPEAYSADVKVRDLLEVRYADLTSVTSPTSSELAVLAFGAFEACRATIQDVRPLNKHAREQVIHRQLYAVTSDNLLELTHAGSIALDDLLQADDRVFKHSTARLNDYLTAFAEVAATAHTIEDPQYFATIVTRACEYGSSEDIRRLVSQASENCLVVTLSEVPPLAWQAILAEERTHSSFANVHSYIAENSRVDDELAAFLAQHSVIKWDAESSPLEDRRTVSQMILKAADVLPDIEARLDLVVQLEPGELPVDEIGPETGELVGRLIEENLIPDDAETFTSHLMVDWNTREAAIAASKDFVSLVSPETLPVSQLPQMLRSDKVTREIKKVVVDRLADYLAHGTKQQAEEIASALNERGWKIRLPRIQALVDRDVSPIEIVRFVVREPAISVDKLREILRKIGDPYERLADVGWRSVILPDDADHRALIERLEGVTVSSVTEAVGELRVNLFRKER